MLPGSYVHAFESRLDITAPEQNRFTVLGPFIDLIRGFTLAQRAEFRATNIEYLKNIILDAEMIFDRDAKYGLQVPATVRDMGMESLPTSWRSPWQNGVAEGWVGSCRRELLDHVIPANERHLRRLLTEYVRYFHQLRIHLGLSKRTPNERARTLGPGKIISCPRLGGLHHRYQRAA